MLSVLERHVDSVKDLCRRHGVSRLEVFGSAVDGSFEPGRSDVDFLVHYPPGTDLGPWLSRYFDLRSDLEMLLGRPVDLIMAKAATNPYFLREMERTRTLLYAA